MNDSFETTELSGASLAQQWRRSADENNPAGPLFTSAYAEADLIGDTSIIESGRCGTACTASRTRYCC